MTGALEASTVPNVTRLTLTTASRGSHGAAQPCGHGSAELRCDCGSLLARVVGREVELKCRRCKRTWRIPIADDV